MVVLCGPHHGPPCAISATGIRRGKAELREVSAASHGWDVDSGEIVHRPARSTGWVRAANAADPIARASAISAMVSRQTDKSATGIRAVPLERFALSRRPFSGTFRGSLSKKRWIQRSCVHPPHDVGLCCHAANGSEGGVRLMGRECGNREEAVARASERTVFAGHRPSDRGGWHCGACMGGPRSGGLAVGWSRALHTRRCPCSSASAR